MNVSPVKYWLMLVCLLAAVYGSFVVWRMGHDAEAGHGAEVPVASTTSKEPPLTDFVLTDQNGSPFDSQSLRGKVWVGSFFFTNCPSACWRLNQALAAIQQGSPDSQVRYISITCDPDNDTPEALTKYAEQFKADPGRWTFLTGDLKKIRQIGNDFFKVAVENKTHSDRAFVVDRQGQVRGRFRLTEPDQVEMLKKLIATVEAEPAENQPGGTEDDSSKLERSRSD
jgi:cytochrome oxidase Cu insertion factor (SCO1/SenC/PrrC family)